MPGLPTTDRRVRARAQRENWPSRSRKGKGGGREYRIVVVPAETLRALLAAETGNDLIRELCRALLAGDDHA